MTTDAPDGIPPHRYDAALADEIERKWQARWREQGTYETPNPVGGLSAGFDRVAGQPKLFVMDMFPYPSGSGLHVGHPLGYIGTDVYARFMRMTGHNVLHTMGYDAFGLPAEEHARQTGQHPRANTEANIATMRAQLLRLGLGHDVRREIATTDVGYYRWTQWIFLQIYNSWYDRDLARARPIAELVAEFASGARALEDGRSWGDLDEGERHAVLNGYRLAYLDEAPVNWCPALGTVLANEEVTAEGRSERGDHPVFKRPLKQWMMRITEYADRLIEDLAHIDWFESVKAMQRNWIGRSEGANVRFPAGSAMIEVFTTRPDTLFGATYMVVAPEHPLVDELQADAWPTGTRDAWTGAHDTPADAVDEYREEAAAKTELDRQAEGREKTGVFIGAFATNPVNGKQIPVFIADYVLMGYGTGAIMAVPGQDERDWEFAEIFDLPIIRTVQPPEDFAGDAYTGDGPAINSGFLDGLGVEDAKRAMIAHLQERGAGVGTTTYKLRDWLFSRQRYWGEPFPIVYDEAGNAVALPHELLPVELPELIDWAPRALDEDSDPEPPLGRATEWATVELDLGEGPTTYRRELNTMPQWAGSCWYYLRYIDPTNTEVVVDPEAERYWMTDAHGGIGGVDLYVGGVEHAVLHLLYARFWHKVLYDLGHVSGPEPFQRLFNQGYIQAAAYQDARGVYVDAHAVEERDGEFLYEGQPVTRTFGKMGKSLKNSVTPDEMYARFGADTLRLYEMFMGPLDQDRPWETRSVTGSMRLLQRVWRNVVDEDTGELTVSDEEPSEGLLRVLHRTIDAVRSDMGALRFNTAIARITELNNELTKLDGPTPRAVAEPLVRMLGPLVPHIAAELWERLGQEGSLVYASFPEADPAYLVEDTIELPVHVNGKMRSSISVAADASDQTITAAALADPKVIERMDGKEVRKLIVVPGRLVNIVV
ncbi:MAG: leucine--tRNA ligase [Thermoleophilia bacterium]|nr:leucine--tRNA ligase [Thermoleophilia bacterium]